MTAHNANHRRAAAAAIRRFQPKFPAQLSLEPRFDPTATFAQMGDSKAKATTTDLFGGLFSDLFPNSDPTSTVTSVVIVTPTPSSSSSSATSSSVASTTTSTSTATTTTVVAPTTTPKTSTIPTTAATSTITSAATDVAGQTSTFVKTISTTRSASSTVAAASATTSTDTSSGVSTGAIVGGIGAGIVAIAAIGFAVVYFFRRARKREADNAEVNFNPSQFRRSAMLMEDPPTHEDTIAQGYNPRPPTMIERRLASPAPTFGTQYGQPGPAYGDNYAAYGAPEHQGGQGGSYPAFGADYYASNVSSPMSANSANPLIPPAAYGQSPFSPIGSPLSANMPMYNERGEPIQGGYLTRQPSYGASLSRQPSAGSPATQLSRQPSAAAMSMYPGAVQTAMHQNQVQYPIPGATAAQAPVPPPIPRESAPVSDYVDLSRSSVSPFQAEQYAEISRRLNTDVPSGLDSPAVSEIVQKARESAADSTEDNGLPPVPPKESNASPFADPADAPAQYASRRTSDTSVAQAYDFPVPPSPAATFSSRYRVDSTPPTLPEIHVESRVSVSSLGAFTSRGTPDPSPLGSGFPSGVTLTAGRSLATFPVTPSPLASSFGVITPPVEKTFAREPMPPTSLRTNTAAAAAASSGAAARDPKPDSQRPNTVYSMYDPEDAYGGI